MGRTVMFIIFIWLIVGIAGGVTQGSVRLVRTTLTSSVNATDTTINVRSTEGFGEQGKIEIGDEHIAYSSINGTAFKGTLGFALIRGTDDTTAVAHTVGAKVSTIEGNMMNNSLDYNVALLSDASGLMAFITIPLALLSMLGNFFVLPIAFLGADLQILTYFYLVIGIGLLVVIGVSMAGGRRV